MTQWSNYHTPSTIEAALHALKSSPDSAIIAGGTDLILDLHQGRHPSVTDLIDISRIPELQTLSVRDDHVVVGTGLPLSRILRSPEVQLHAPGLIEACGLIGGPQVRNVATLGGNVAHALPAGDGTIALLSLGAEAQLVSQDSYEWVPLPSLFTGPGEVSFDRKKVIISALRFPMRGDYEGSAFRRVMRPQGVAIAILNMGTWLKVDPTGIILKARISVGPGGPTPFLSVSGSQSLSGKRLDDRVVDEAAREILIEVRFRTSKHRASKAYREHLLPALLQQTLQVAYQRAVDHHEE